MKPAISYGGDLPDDPTHPLTLGEALIQAAQRFPGTGLRIDGGSFDTYPELLAQASRVVTALGERGVGNGETAVLRVQDDQYFPVFWGCVLAGVIPVTTGPVPSYDQDNPALNALLHTWRKLDRPMVIGGDDDLTGLRRLSLADRVVSATELLSANECTPSPSARPDDLALLQLSSGSTGTPKIIQITHRGVSEYAVGARVLLDIRPGDTLLNWLPLDHVAGLMLYHLGGVFLGAGTVQAATEPILADPLRWLDLMHRWQVTHAWAPNFAYRMVTDALAGTSGRHWDLSRVRRLVSGGEQCTPDTFQSFVDATAGFGVTARVMAPGWGMSETCTGITFADFGEPYCVQGGYLSVGPPAPGATLRIVDGDFNVLTEGEIGRLQVRSARVTPGYVKDPGADQVAFPVPGWLDTGDLAYLLDGRVTITGREKDLVILHGHNYPCHEIEQAAQDVAGIADRLVAACGVPDEQTGTERLVIFYAPAAGAEHDRVAADIVAAIGRRLQLPVAQVVPVADFPRTGGGKIQRGRLRESFLARTIDVHAEVLRAVGHFVAGAVDVRRPFYELGLGSVQMVQLRDRLQEALGREISQATLFAHPTVEALSDFLSPSDRPMRTSQPVELDSDRRVAVIGMAARLPGAASVEDFWTNLVEGVSSVRTFSAQELMAAGVPARVAEDPEFVGASGVLDDIAGFDAEFFGISAREAALLDPQHRLFLETCHHALEDAGYAGAQSVRIGLFAGGGMNLYPHHSYLRNNLGAATSSTDVATSIGVALGNQPDFLATRVAYRLGLTGPAIGVQTACSTSLVAVHLAAQALAAGEADLALAGAVALHVPQVTGYHYSPDTILSRDGSCRPFDADADGTVGGNGVAAVVLKPLAKALADGDTIHAMLLGSAVNNDGAAKVGFTAPGMAGQVEVIGSALRRAGVSAESIGYVEAHGTGTALGDPIEFEALTRAYPTGSRLLGSVKANIGHLDSCAGMAGLLKTVLMVRHGVVPPQVNFRRANPALGLDGSAFRITTERQSWTGPRPRRAAVSALGVGGTNAHVIVEEPPEVPAPSASIAPDLLVLSAADPAVLPELADRLRRVSARRADVVHTAAVGRRHLRHRMALTGDRVVTGEARSGPVAFALSGQGVAVERGFELAQRFPAVREMWELLDKDLAGRLRGGDRTTEVVQPALVALGLGLTNLWRAWGVRPAYALGHSVGEYAALAVAGALTPGEAISLASHRGRLMQEMPPGEMAALFATRSTVDELIAGVPGLELAAVNGPEQFVVAGPPEAVARAMADGPPMLRLGVTRAFHTSAVDHVLDDFAPALELRPTRLPFISTVDGLERAPGWLPTRAYLLQQARKPVLFDAAVVTLAATGCVVALEAGPDAVLTGMARDGLKWIASQPSAADPIAGIWRAAAEFYCSGADLDWPSVMAGSGGRRVPLPQYPFQHKRFWISPEPVPVLAEEQDSGVLARVRTMTAASLGLRPDEVGADDAFVALGADSLLLVSMSREVQREFGVRIPVRDLFGDLSTPAHLATAISAAPSISENTVSATACAEIPAEDPTLAQIVQSQLELMQKQIQLLSDAESARPSEDVTEPARPSEDVTEPARPSEDVTEPADGTDGIDLSLYFFGDYPSTAERDRYRLILEAADFADRNGFHALWIPERHFHSFGGLFPNPSVLAAAIAVRTSRVRINAGSVVLPLHHPIRVAEEWSMVDNLSGGRVGLGCAPGWHANDFVFQPEHFGRHKEVMYQHLETIRRLWRGQSVSATSGSGEQIDVTLFPPPVQAMPPMFTAIVGNPESYREAARRDVGVVTNLMTQDIGQLAENIALYRRSRAEHGLDPQGGRVVVLLHTYLGEDLDRVRAEAFEPFCAYLKSSLSLLGQVVNSLGMNIDLAGADPDDVRFLMSQAYQRYCEQRALIGTSESCRAVLESVLTAGADEIAAFVDFGMPADRVLAGLPHLSRLRRQPTRLSKHEESAPLTPAQRRLWLTEQLHPGLPAYNEAAVIRLVGRLDVAALNRALAMVVERHAPLRTVYRESSQLIRAHVAVTCPVMECEGDEESAVRAALEQESARLFDLAEGPVFAFTLLRFSDDHHVLVLCFHHLAMDGRSYAVFTEELSRLYRGATVPALPISYPEFARSLAVDAPRCDTSIRYWQSKLVDLPANLTIPSDLVRPAAPTAAGRSVFVTLPPELTARIRQFSRDHRLTPFTTLLSAFAAALARMSGESDFVIGTGVTNRTEQTANLIGFFVDTVPLRFTFSDGLGFAEFATTVQSDAADAYANAVPFDDLVAAVAPKREAGRNPFFDVAVEYETGGAFAFDFPGVSATPLDAGLDKAPVDLMVYLSHGEAVRCHVEFRTEVLDETSVRRLLDLFRDFLDAAMSHPTTPLAQLSTAGHSVVSGRTIPRPESLLHELFLRQADQTPEAIAIVDGDHRLTYHELRERAWQITKELAVEPGEIVAVVLPRTAELIAAQLAVMMSGGAFLPLDPELPTARLRQLLDDSGARLTIAETGVTEADLPVRTHPHQPAWCVYTSGSTGSPKGVLVPHSAAVNSIGWHITEIDLSPADTVAHGLAIGFDANLSEIYPALASGATLHLVPEDTRTDPQALARWWSQHGITVAFLPTPVAELILTQPVPISLRTLVIGGSRLRQRPPAHLTTRVLNAYGPTENTIVTTAGMVTSDGPGPIDIGRPIDNVTVEIRDPHGRPLPPGAPGELWVSGRNLAIGYLDQPFVDGVYRTGDRARLRGDGTIEYLGRLDDQVKIGGHRVEPAEVSAVLTNLPGVRQCAVVARHDRGDDPYLAAYIVGDDPREHLPTLLPTYLIPRTWTFLPDLPLTPTGKVDTAALPSPESPQPGPPPVTATEQAVHDCWCNEIGVSSLPVDVTFFAAGGTSLAAMRVANRLGLAVHEVLAAPGIRGLARTLRVEETAPATHQQEQMWHRQRRAPNQATAHIALRITLTGSLDLTALTHALNLLVDRHAPLRTNFVERDGQLRQEVLTHEPISVPVSDVDPAELAQWCVERGRAPFPGPPLLRAALARIADGHWVLLLTVHHLAADGWSVLRLIEELQEAYPAALEGRPATLPALPMSYPDYARRQRSTPARGEVLDYWRTRLQDLPRSVELPTDRPRPATTGRGADHSFVIGTELTARLETFARSQNTSLFPVLASAYAVLLHRRTGAQDIVLACPYAHRDSRELDPIVGFFAGGIQLRLRPRPELSFADLVADTDLSMRDALRHQPMFIPELFQALDPQWRRGLPAPTGDLSFAWNPGMPTLSLPGLTAQLSDQALACSRRDLALMLAPDGDHLSGAVEYSTELFDAQTIVDFCAEYVQILAEVGA